MSGDMIQQKCSKVMEKDWKDATCSVCMEYPHNAVLLLCSSHDKGCRPYMCGTSCRYSNCLDQYKKAYSKAQPLHDSAVNPVTHAVSNWSVEKCEVAQLACPLCRGQVKGWTVVEPARAFLNAKKRTCMQEKCSFVGTYKELRRHVRAEHPSARPREVDPVEEQKWRRLEHEQERDDVISTITSSMPGAMVFGDYVIEGSHYGFDTDEEDGFDANVTEIDGNLEMGIDSNLVNVFLLLHALGPTRGVGRHAATRRQDMNLNRALDGNTAVGHASPVYDLDSYSGDGVSDEDGEENAGQRVSRLRREGRVLLGRSGRRRQNREASGGR